MNTTLLPTTLECRERAARRDAIRLLLIGAAFVLLPLSATLAVRSLVLDHRGNAIYAQRAREEGTLKGFFTGEGKGFQARETSRSGWKRGQLAIVTSIVGAAMVAVGAVKSRWRRPARVALVCHAVIAIGLLAYWILTGIPQPWQD